MEQQELIYSLKLSETRSVNSLWIPTLGHITHALHEIEYFLQEGKLPSEVEVEGMGACHLCRHFWVANCPGTFTVYWPSLFPCPTQQNSLYTSSLDS